jgi:hypothetical protein
VPAFAFGSHHGPLPRIALTGARVIAIVIAGAGDVKHETSVVVVRHRCV